MDESTTSNDRPVSSPDGRFIRYGNDPIGQGSFKMVYKGYDAEEGIEVAWNQLDVSKLSEYDYQSLQREIEILSRIKSPNIIQFFASFEIAPPMVSTKQFVFITELMTSGTVRQFLNKVKSTNLKIVKKWSSQVLAGLNYLHTQNPKIIHRDLKCDNIFINGNHGEVKIGDLGLSRTIVNRAASVAGTPEFMAPECYEGDYDERADIYSFGLCLLEMVTFEYPYQECTSPVQIWRKVSNFIPPDSLALVEVTDLREIILLCIGPSETRPSASQLLESSFFNSNEDDALTCFMREGQTTKTVLKQRAASHMSTSMMLNVKEVSPTPDMNLPIARHSISPPTKHKCCKDVQIKLRITDEEGDTQIVEFPFNETQDTPEKVAEEMVHALHLKESNREYIIESIRTCLRDCAAGNECTFQSCPAEGVSTPINMSPKAASALNNIKFPLSSESSIEYESMTTPSSLTGITSLLSSDTTRSMSAFSLEDLKALEIGASANSSRSRKKQISKSVDVQELINGKLKETLREFDEQ